MQSQEIKHIVHKLAIEYNLHDEDIREIVRYQFKFLRKIMASASKKLLNYKTFRIRNIGAFYVPQARIRHQKRYFNGEDNNAGRSS